MARPRDLTSFALGLASGPQAITIGPYEYICYLYLGDWRFIAVRATNLTVYELQPQLAHAQPLFSEAVPPVALSVWAVSAQDLIDRAAKVPQLTQADARVAITAHYVYGLVTPSVLAEDLAKLLSERKPDETALYINLLAYSYDRPNSPRLLAACAAAVVALTA